MTSSCGRIIRILSAIQALSGCSSDPPSQSAAPGSADAGRDSDPGIEIPPDSTPPSLDSGTDATAQPQGCFRPCGGELQGLWRLESTCTSDLTGGCKKGFSYFTSSLSAASGVLNFVGGTLSMDLKYSQRAEVLISSDCAAQAGFSAPGPTACADLTPELTSTSIAGTISEESCSYSYSPSGCRCSFVVNVDYKSSQQAYSISGNTFSYPVAPNSVESVEYCVSGDVLTLRSALSGEIGLDTSFIFRREAEACPATSRFCDGRAIYSCDSFGLTRSLVETCRNGDVCVAGGGTASCQLLRCTADAPACDGPVHTTCDATGLGYVGPRQACDPATEKCTPGVGCVEAVFHDVGQSTYCNAAPSAVGQMVGNVYEATRDARLVEFSPYVQVSKATNITFAVYEATAFTGPYTNILRTRQRADAGVGYRSSGPINVVVRAGRYYGTFYSPDDHVGSCSFNPGNTDVGFGFFVGRAFAPDPITETDDVFARLNLISGPTRQGLWVASLSTPPDGGLPAEGGRTRK